MLGDEYYPDKTYTPEEQARIEQAIQGMQDAGEDLLVSFDHDVFTKLEFTTFFVRAVLKSQRDDDLCEASRLMENYYRAGHTEIAAIIMPLLGYDWSRCEADWSEDED